MKLIFVNRFFYPDHSATSQMLSDLAFALAASGAHVQIITSRLRYDQPGRDLPRSETIRGVEVLRVATTAFGRGSLAGRALDYLTFYLAVAWALLVHTRRDDIIIAKTDPPLLSVIAAPIARLRKAHLVNWLQDIFPEVAEALMASESRAAKMGMKLLRTLRDYSLRNAVANVVIGERMAAKISALGVQSERITVIPNWADGALIHPIRSSENNLRQTWGLGDAFVVGYSGNLGRAHDITAMLDAIAELESQTQSQSQSPEPNTAKPSARKIRWLFIGGGARSEHLRREVERRGLATVDFRPYQPRTRLAESLSAADVHLVSLQPELEGLIVPSKYYGIAAAGRAAIFIGDPDGEIARVLAKNETGATVPQGDGTALAHAIKRLAENPETAGQHGANARQLFDRQYDLPIAVTSWEQVFDGICSRHNSRWRQ